MSLDITQPTHFTIRAFGRVWPVMPTARQELCSLLRPYYINWGISEALSVVASTPKGMILVAGALLEKLDSEVTLLGGYSDDYSDRLAVLVSLLVMTNGRCLDRFTILPKEKLYGACPGYLEGLYDTKSPTTIILASPILPPAQRALDYGVQVKQVLVFADNWCRDDSVEALAAALPSEVKVSVVFTAKEIIG